MDFSISQSAMLLKSLCFFQTFIHTHFPLPSSFTALSSQGSLPFMIYEH